MPAFGTRRRRRRALGSLPSSSAPHGKEKYRCEPSKDVLIAARRFKVAGTRIFRYFVTAASSTLHLPWGWVADSLLNGCISIEMYTVFT